MDSTIAVARYQQVRGEYLRLLGEIARLQAEAAGGDPVFPDELAKEAPEIVESKKQLCLARQQELANDILILKRQVFQREQQLAELTEKTKGLKASLNLLEKELELNRVLAERGAVSEGEMLRLERLHADKENELKVAELTVPRADAALKEAIRRVEARKLSFVNEALTLLNQKEARLAEISETATAEEERLRRTEVVSPINGIVKEIHITTIGGVIQSGDTIMEIVPMDDTLLIEARILPQDVGFLRPGLPATVGITAYDPAIYGTLDATIEYISADTLTNQSGKSFYRVYLRTTTNSFEKDGKAMPIIPGMTALADILTGKRTVLCYLLKPIHRGMEGALHER